MPGVHLPCAHSESVATKAMVPPSPPRAHLPEPLCPSFPWDPEQGRAGAGGSCSTDFPTPPSWEGSAAQNLSQDQRRLRRGGLGAETLPTLPSEAARHHGATTSPPCPHHVPTMSPPCPHHVPMSPAQVSSTPRLLQPLGQLCLSQVPPTLEQGHPGKQPWLSPLLFRQD